MQIGVYMLCGIVIAYKIALISSPLLVADSRIERRDVQRGCRIGIELDFSSHKETGLSLDVALVDIDAQTSGAEKTCEIHGSPCIERTGKVAYLCPVMEMVAMLVYLEVYRIETSVSGEKAEDVTIQSHDGVVISSQTHIVKAHVVVGQYLSEHIVVAGLDIKFEARQCTLHLGNVYATPLELGGKGRHKRVAVSQNLAQPGRGTEQGKEVTVANIKIDRSVGSGKPRTHAIHCHCSTFVSIHKVAQIHRSIQQQRIGGIDVSTYVCIDTHRSRGVADLERHQVYMSAVDGSYPIVTASLYIARAFDGEIGRGIVRVDAQYGHSVGNMQRPSYIRQAVAVIGDVRQVKVYIGRCMRRHYVQAATLGIDADRDVRNAQ